MTSTHIEESQFYECRVKDNDDFFLQFHVQVLENCESKRMKRSSADSFSINPAIDVSTTITSVWSEILDRLELSKSGGGLQKPEPGVCCQKRANWWLVLSLFLPFPCGSCLGSHSFHLAFYRTFRCLFMVSTLRHFMPLNPSEWSSSCHCGQRIV